MVMNVWNVEGGLRISKAKMTQTKCLECKFLTQGWFEHTLYYKCDKNEYHTLRVSELRPCSDFRKKEEKK